MNMISSEPIESDIAVPALDRQVSGPTAKITELSRKLETALETIPNVAEIVLTVTDFREVLHTRAVDRGTQYKMSMGKDHSHIFVDQSGDAPKLKVKKDCGPIILKFTIVDTRTTETYYPLAISFKWHSSIRREKHPKCDLDGRENVPFDSMHVYGTHVYLIGFLMPQEKGVDYKFSAIFQREDAKIAIIDPGIENDDQI